MQNTTYSAGTVSVPAAGLTVTGSGTAWATFGVRAGDMILIGGQLALIASVNSNTSITLKRPWAGAAQSGVTYDILLLDDEVRALIAANSLLQALSGGTLTSLGQIAGAANQMPYWTGAGVMEATGITPEARALLGSALLSRSGNNLVTGANARITGGAVTQGATDSTPGRLLRVGDFGLGGNAATLVGSIDALTIPTGAYYSPLAQGGTRPIAASGYLTVLRESYVGVSVRQTFYHSASNSAWTRRGSSNAGTWTAWAQIVDSESGSNANGEFVKFSDGTLICEGEVEFAAVGNASGGGFVSSSAFWTFPAGFANAEAVRAISGHAGLDCTVTAQGGSALGSNIRLQSLTQISAARKARVMAIGRWK